MNRTATIATFLLLGAFVHASVSWAASLDERFLAGLRARQLFELAEKYCADLLQDPQLTDERRADLTIECSRTWAEHALASPAERQPALWQNARQIAEDFAVRNPGHSKLLLVRFQGLLAAVAQGETTLEDAQQSSDQRPALEAARGVLRAAISQLRALDEQIGAELQRRNRTPRGKQDVQVSTDQLASLQRHIRYQLARALRNQGLCYPAGSADRTNALTQAVELLKLLVREGSDPSLTWASQLDELACWRLLEDYDTAASAIAQLEKAHPPVETAASLRVERIRLALARGRIDDAISEAGAVGARQWSVSPEADMARLETYLTAWQRAMEREPRSATEWEDASLKQVRAIGQAHGGAWMRKAENLLARQIANAGADNPDALVRAAQSFYRSGRADEAVATYDRAASRARDKANQSQAFDIAYTAAAIENERAHYRQAIDRYRSLATAMPTHANAAAAHLSAIHCAAQLAQQQHGQEKQPEQLKLDEYEQLLREHVATWPQSPTASQAWCWLGRLLAHDRAWAEAVRALRNVKAADPRYPTAVEAVADCYQTWLAELRRDGKENSQLARDAVRYFEQVIGPPGNHPEPSNGATRTAVLAAAKICLLEIPNSATQAESILNSALRNSADAPADWTAAARRLLVVALAAQGRDGEAVEQLKHVTGGSPADRRSMVNLLAELADRAPAERQRKLAAVELRGIDDLIERERPDAATLEDLANLQAVALTRAGRHSEAVALMESLAKTNPRDGQAQENLASLLTDAPDAESLKAALVKWREVASKSRPASPRWFRAEYGVARAQLKLGNRGQARARIKLLESSHPDLGGAEMKEKFRRLLAECEAAPSR